MRLIARYAMRFGGTAKVLPNCKLKYFRIPLHDEGSAAELAMHARKQRLLPKRLDLKDNP